MVRAPEFPQNLRWLASQPLSVRELRGNVVLIDFWTYSCVNCIRALPHVKRWHEKYSKNGLVVVGVHTPEFEFEKNLGNVERAVKNFGIEYPVVMDNDYQIWSLYSNQYWPRKFLVNKEGKVIYDHIGEGGYKETEEAIQKALLEIDPELKLPPTEEDAHPSTSLPRQSSGQVGAVCVQTTPETYLGTMRGRTGKTWNYFGIWKVHPEFIEHERHTESFVDYIELNFEGAEVNLVVESLTEQPAKVRLELNDDFLKELEVHEARMYNLVSPLDFARGKPHDIDVKSPPASAAASAGKRGTLKIFSKDEGLRAYAFTFGGCAQ